MNHSDKERTLQVIAAEIISYQEQSRKIRLLCAIEIGRRLKEAKALIPYGEWGTWLEESVSYSQRTATNLIRLFEEYEGKQTGLPDWQTFANLSYSQALVLLDIPEEERAPFIDSLDIDNMSVRELQKVVKERDQVRQENVDLIQKLANSQKELEETKAKACYLTLIDTSDKLTFQYNRAQAGKTAYLYEELEKRFKELLQEMKELEKSEPEAHRAYKQMLNTLLDKVKKEISVKVKVQQLL